MKIKMISTEQGSVDGIKVATFAADREYDLGQSPGSISLADAFLAAGLASPLDPHLAPPPDEPLSAATTDSAQRDMEQALVEGADDPSSAAGGDMADAPAAAAVDTQSGMSKAELQAALTVKGIKFPAAANKAELAALLG